MKGYAGVRDKLKEDEELYSYLDASQLVKHALPLRTQANRIDGEYAGLKPNLFYAYADPKAYPDSGKPVDKMAKSQHRKEVDHFAKEVTGDEVTFIACAYSEMLKGWKHGKSRSIRQHAETVFRCFAP